MLVPNHCKALQILFLKIDLYLLLQFIPSFSPPLLNCFLLFFYPPFSSLPTTFLHTFLFPSFLPLPFLTAFVPSSFPSFLPSLLPYFLHYFLFFLLPFHRSPFYLTILLSFLVPFPSLLFSLPYFLFASIPFFLTLLYSSHPPCIFPSCYQNILVYFGPSSLSYSPLFRHSFLPSFSPPFLYFLRPFLLLLYFILFFCHTSIRSFPLTC